MQRSVPCASDLAELPEQVIWQNCLYVEERASGLAELPVCGQCCASGLAELHVPVIWQNCLYLDSVTVIWQNCLYLDSVTVIWQNCLYAEECAMCQ